MKSRRRTRRLTPAPVPFHPSHDEVRPVFKPRLLSGLAGVGLLAAVVGCGQSSAPAPTSSGTPVGSTTTPVGKADGKSVFDTNCTKCHALNGVGGGKGGGKGG